MHPILLGSVIMTKDQCITHKNSQLGDKKKRIKYSDVFKEK